jgi:hypothetical protein
MFDDSVLLHDVKNYNPLKAHEYYVRTRELKGRVAGKDAIHPKAVTGPKAVSSPTAKSRVVKATPVNKGMEQKHQEAEAQVAAFRARLDKLHGVLAQLVKKAKARSGVETPHEGAKRKAEAQREAKDKTPQTAEQKRKQAVSSKKSYEKNKELHPRKKTSSPSQEIDDLREKIASIRTQLHDAIERARATSAKSNSRPVVPTQRRHDKAVATN